MRLLLVTWNYPPKVGGMEMLLSQLVQNLCPYADVHVIGPGGQAVDSEQRVKVSRPSREGLVWFALYAFFKGIRLLRGNTYDAIMGGSALVTPLVYVLGRLFGLPVVVSVHGLDLIYSQPLYQWMIKRFLPRCTRVFANSQASKEEALKRGVSPDRIFIINPGLDFSEFETVPDVERIRQRYDVDGLLVLLSVGRLAKRKGIPEFIKHSLPTIVQEYHNIVFLIAGGNPTQSLAHKEDIRARVEAVVKEQGLGDHVRILGRVEREALIDLYYACDVFVLPAIRVPDDMEGFGIVLTEASAAGKPVVSTRLGGITDAVVDGRSGILVEAERWDALSDAVLRLLADESLRQEMGRFGRERVRAELDWQIVAGRYLERLKDL